MCAQLCTRVPVCTLGLGTPRDLALDTQLWIHSSVHPAAGPPGKKDVCVGCVSVCLSVSECVRVCVCVTTELCWLEWPLALWAHSVFVAERDAQDRAGACPLSCPHPHRVVTIPRGCWWCCQCCLCPHRALQPPQLSPPLPARCRLASVAEMVRAQPRGWEQPGPAAIAPGQCWAVTQDSAGL